MKIKCVNQDTNLVRKCVDRVCNCILLTSDQVSLPQDAGGRHETPGTETKKFITHSRSSSQSFMLICIGSLCLPSPMRAMQGL